MTPEIARDIAGDAAKNGYDLVDQAYKIGMLQARREIETLLGFLVQRSRGNAIEIGVYKGGTSFLWSHLYHRLIGIDLPRGRGGRGLGEDETALRKRNKIFSSPHRLLELDSGDPETRDRVKDILDGEWVDFLFVDGDHSYESVVSDFELYRPFVRTGGIVAFHDVHHSEYHERMGCQVGRFWRQLEGDKLELWAGYDWGGIGVLFV